MGSGSRTQIPQTRAEDTAATSTTKPRPDLTPTRDFSPCFSGAVEARLQPKRHFSNRVSESRYVATYGPLAVEGYVRPHGTIYWLRSGRASDGAFFDFAITVRNVSRETAHNAELRARFTNLDYLPSSVALRNPEHPIPLHEPEVGYLDAIGIGDLAPNETAALCFSGHYHEPAPTPNESARLSLNGSVTAHASAEPKGRAGSATVTVASFL